MEYVLFYYYIPIIQSSNITVRFRGFVHEKKLTAVSQYYDTAYYDFLVKNKARIII